METASRKYAKGPIGSQQGLMTREELIKDKLEGAQR